MQENNYIREYHPDWYFDIPQMFCLILGSFPPHEIRRDYDFYYPNKQNHFWRILSAVNDNELIHTSGNLAVEERQRIMIDLKVGVQNMGKTILRNGTSAKDTDIIIEEYQDIFSIIKKHTELKRILLPGFSAENSTAKTFVRYLISNGIPISHQVVYGHEFEFSFDIGNRTIECVILNSTSTALRRRLEEYIPVFKKYIDSKK